MNSRDLAARLHDVNLVFVDLLPIDKREEADGARGSDCQLFQLSVDLETLNGVVADLDLEKLFARLG